MRFNLTNFELSSFLVATSFNVVGLFGLNIPIVSDVAMLCLVGSFARRSISGTFAPYHNNPLTIGLLYIVLAVIYLARIIAGFGQFDLPVVWDWLGLFTNLAILWLLFSDRGDGGGRGKKKDGDLDEKLKNLAKRIEAPKRPEAEGSWS